MQRFFTLQSPHDNRFVNSTASRFLGLEHPITQHTCTAIPQRLRRTKTQRMADLARKRARYAQRTEAQRLYDAHKKRTSRGSFLHHLGGASPATGEHQSLRIGTLLMSDLETGFCSYSVLLFVTVVY